MVVVHDNGVKKKSATCFCARELLLALFIWWGLVQSCNFYSSASVKARENSQCYSFYVFPSILSQMKEVKYSEESYSGVLVLQASEQRTCACR